MNRKIAAVLLATIASAIATPDVPRPDHIVVVIDENHSWGDVIGSGLAPYIDSLAADIGANGHTAAMTQSFGTAPGTQPSQPNYLELYSGDSQGVINDYFPPAGSPFTTPNLGRELLDAGLTFKTFSEHLLGQGYAAKHNPAINWVGTGQNQIPASTQADFSAFPINFWTLPTVCYVVPILTHDMHSPDRDLVSIPIGDQWLHDNMDAYIQWCKSHNSLFILTFDEGSYPTQGPLPTLIIGDKVQPGTYPETARNGISHYSILRTIEDAYDLPHAGAADAPPPSPAPVAIRNIWVSEIILTYQNTNRNVTLDWSGATSQTVDVYRNGVLRATTPNDGLYRDTLPPRSRPPMRYVYKVCESGTQTCSNEVTIMF